MLKGEVRAHYKGLRMSSIARSMDKKLPKVTLKGTPKGKGKKDDDQPPSYVPHKMKTSMQSFVDTKVPTNKGTCIFRGEFVTPQNKKVQMVTLPKNFQQMGRDEQKLKVYKQLGINKYSTLSIGRYFRFLT